MGFVARYGGFAIIWRCDWCLREVCWPDDAAILVGEAAPRQDWSEALEREVTSWPTACVHREGCLAAFREAEGAGWVERTTPELAREYWRHLWLGQLVEDATCWRAHGHRGVRAHRGCGRAPEASTRATRRR